MDIKNGVVAILKNKNTIIGTGFVAGENSILTCAHVVERVPGTLYEQVNIRFSDNTEATALVDQQYSSPSLDGSDIALLRVASLPQGITPLPLGKSAGSADHDFYAYGYAIVTDVQGIGARGKLVDIVDNGRLVQLTSQEPDKGMSGGPVLDEQRQVIIGIITKGKSVAKEGESLRNIFTTFATSVEVILKVCPELRLTEICPYRSLDVFNEADAPFFYGRAKVVQKLVDSLKREPRFLAVLGPSGSGKSSVVRAGLIPVLRQGKVPGSQKWDIITIRPANDPFEQLALAGFTRLEDGLEVAVQAWLTHQPEKTRLVLFIDQFEEVLVTPQEVQRKFLAELARLLDGASAITLVLTLRDDFYSRFLRDAAILVGWLENGLVNTPPTLEQDDLRAMIAEPAKRIGLTFDDGLVDDIIADACESDQATPGLARSTILPLLEFALTQLWELRTDERLTHEAYKNIGGTTGGLSQWADKAYFAFSQEERKVVEHIFCSLVHLGDEKQNIPDVRRMTTLDEVENRQKKALVITVVDKLIRARLLSVHREDETGMQHIEIIHDALLHAWKRLEQWIDNYRHREQRARERRRLFIIFGLLAALVVMIGLAAFAWNQRNNAVARLLVAQSAYTNVARSSKQMLADLLAIRSLQMLPSAEAAQVLLNSTEARELLHLNLGAAVNSVAFSPDSQYVLAASGNDVVILDATSGEQVARLPHDDLVYMAAFSPNGKYLVSGSRDRNVRVWEVPTGALVQKLALDGNVYAVAFSPDSNLVAGGGDQFVRVWKATTGTKISRMRINNGPVYTLAFSPDGKSLATGDNRSARVWDVLTSAELARMNHGKPVHALAFSPDGKTVVSGGDDFTVRIWNVADGSQIAEAWHAGAVTAVAFSPDGAYVVSGSRDNTARVWDPHSGGEVERMTFDGSVFAVGFSPPASTTGYVLSAGADFTARVWDAGDGHEIARMTHDSWVSSVAFSPDGEYVASGGDDHTLRIWPVASGLERARVTHRNRVYTVAFSPDGKYALSGSADKTLRVWDAATGEEKLRLTHDDTVFSAVFSKDGNLVASGGGHNIIVADVASSKELANIIQEGQIYTVAISPDNQYVVTGSSDNTARVWNIQAHTEIARVTHDAKLQIVAFSPDGKYVLSGSADQTARVWDALTGREVTHVMHSAEVYSAAFSPDGKYVVSGDDRSARVWETLTGKIISSVAHTNFVYGVAFSPNGKYVVSGSADHIVRVWETLSGRELAVMKHDGVVNTVAFSPDGQYVLSGDDKGAHIWEAFTGREAARITHNNLVKALAFSPNGQYVLSGGVDKTARIWPWRTQDLLAGACASMSRNLTQDEWKFYMGEEPYRIICANLPVAPEPRETPKP